MASPEEVSGSELEPPRILCVLLVKPSYKAAQISEERITPADVR